MYLTLLLITDVYICKITHHFQGAKYLKDFNDLQIQNVASMHEENSRRFWSLRFSLDSQLKVALYHIPILAHSPLKP